MKRSYCHLETTGEHLEESNEVLPHYFNPREEIHKTAKCISTIVKMDLHDLVESRQMQWNGEIYTKYLIPIQEHCTL
jgi:hypothetical protein